MATFNNCEFIGNVGKDPELAVTDNGKPIARFSLAVDQPGDLGTLWMNIVAWDRLAEIVEKYIVKGDQVLVQGRLQRRKYTDKNGVERVAEEIIATTVLSLEKKKGGDTLPTE